MEATASTPATPRRKTSSSRNLKTLRATIDQMDQVLPELEAKQKAAGSKILHAGTSAD